MAKDITSYRWQCAQLDQTLLSSALGSAYEIETGRHKQAKLQVYDSFGRGFIESGMALVRNGGHFQVVEADDLLSNPIQSDMVVRHHKPVFYWDFEPGKFREQLRRTLKLRAAVQLATLALEDNEFCIRNRDGKIVLRLWQQSVHVDAHVAVVTLTAVPLVGYENEATTIAQLISAVPEFSLEPIPLASRVLDLVGKGEPPLSPKKVIQLKPDETVQAAITRIAGLMVRVARQSEPGIIEDIDTEYLHDYRVSIRKLRSVIALVKGAYPREDTRRLKDCFKNYAQATNRMRDLDVYLLDEANYRNQLPSCLRPGLNRMFADFRAERSRVLGQVRRRLHSPDYMESMTQQFNWFSRTDLPSGARADMPIGKVVVKEIRKHYKLIRKLGTSITDATPDDEVHELRIECKKLRYLLELFASLFPEKEMNRILKRLRGLQNVLGDFNDYSVQRESMLDYLNGAKQMDKMSAAAVGALISVLHNKQLDARAHVTEKFKEFSDGKMKERFNVLFKGVEASIK